MRLSHVFRGDQEGPITFLPTYKYDNGKDIYDTRQEYTTSLIIHTYLGICHVGRVFSMI